MTSVKEKISKINELTKKSNQKKLELAKQEAELQKEISSLQESLEGTIKEAEEIRSNISQLEKDLEDEREKYAKHMKDYGLVEDRNDKIVVFNAPSKEDIQKIFDEYKGEFKGNLSYFFHELCYYIDGGFELDDLQKTVKDVIENSYGKITVVDKGSMSYDSRAEDDTHYFVYINDQLRFDSNSCRGSSINLEQFGS